MSLNIKFVGVDSCTNGWVSVGVSANGKCAVEMFRKFDELLKCYKAAKLILVDIPIGLPDGANERRCDKQARKRDGPLSELKSSVFPAPTRAALQYLANNRDDRSGAKDENMKATKTSKRPGGKSLSNQTLDIMPKMIEVDNVMTAPRPNTSPEIREIHPEICFWALNGRKHLISSKKEPQGIEERIGILQKVWPDTDDILDKSCPMIIRKYFASDDLLDALAAAVTAFMGWPCELQTLPEPPQRAERILPVMDVDAELPMEMVFWEPFRRCRARTRLSNWIRIAVG